MVFDATIIDSRVAETAKIYNAVRVIRSILQDVTSIGDFSVIDNSKVGSNARVDRYNHIYYSQLGDYSYTGMNTVVMHASIGRFCSISWNVSIGGADHDYTRACQHALLYNDYGLRPQQEKEAYDRFSDPLVIGSDVWIAAGAAIKRGISIGHGAVIGANCVVTKDVPPYAIVAGVPGKIVGYRFSEAVIEKMLSLEWWLWDKDTITRHYGFLSGKPDEAALDLLLEQLDDR